MRIWKGKLTLQGVAAHGRGARDGEEVDVCVIMGSDAPPDIHVEIGTDRLGVPRYRVATAGEFDPQSVFRALAMTQPDGPRR